MLFIAMFLTHRRMCFYHNPQFWMLHIMTTINSSHVLLFIFEKKINELIMHIMYFPTTLFMRSTVLQPRHKLHW